MKIINISKCVYCPYIKTEQNSFINKRVHWCYLSRLEIHDIEFIPTWCSLTDAPDAEVKDERPETPAQF